MDNPNFGTSVETFHQRKARLGAPISIALLTQVAGDDTVSAACRWPDGSETIEHMPAGQVPALMKR